MVRAPRLPRILAIIAFAALLVPWSLPAAPWEVIGDQSRLGFTATFEEIPFDGEFRNWRADLRFDQTSATGTFDVTVETGSVDSNLTERDDALRLDEWFGVVAFPRARFFCDAFERVPDGFQCQGRLSLKGREQPLGLRFSWDQQADRVAMVGHTELNRLDFAIGEGEDFSGDDVVGRAVKVWFRLALRRR